MTGRYFHEIGNVLALAGLTVRVESVNAGWETRARSSGGFAEGLPLGTVWHHTASSASPESDLSYMIHGSPDAPIGNLLLDRDGQFWPIAAGAANTQGKGGPVTFTRGTVPIDTGNSQLWAIEAANNGVGERWPQVQIDAYFAGSNALNDYFGNDPTDAITHAAWTTRKIDPATATAVDGPWQPLAVNSSGTWDVDDVAQECLRRSDTRPPPPSTTEEVDMFVIAVSRDGWPGPVDLLVAADGTRWNQNGHTSSLDRLAGVPRIDVDKTQTLGLLVDRPGIGEHPFDRPDYLDAELAEAW